MGARRIFHGRLRHEQLAMPDLGSEEDVKKESDRAADKRRQELDDLFRLMSLPWGRRIMRRLIRESKLFSKDLFNANGSMQSRNLGGRDLGLLFHNDLKSRCPDLYLLMEQETEE